MSFVPVTGRATFRTADPPRESVVEFTDERRTVSLPIRAALPVLSRAHARDDVHPSVGLLAGAALLGLRLVAAGKFEPAGSAPSWRMGPLDDADDDRVRMLAGARADGPGEAADAEQVVRGVLDAVVDAMPRSAPVAAPARADVRHRSASGKGFSARLQQRLAQRRGGGEPTTGPSWCGSRCGSRPTRRSWSPAPCGWCSRCTTSRTRSTSARRPSCGPSRGPRPATASATARARTRRIALRAAADAWPVLDRLLELRVPDQITLDTDELASLLEAGVGALRERGVDVLWPRSLGRDLTATTVLDRTPGTREGR